ncbi:hypothetical protein L286_23055 [Sphingobium sp. HDIP04]|nr:hypothetical protein L286_23055 [Sphingobium sp. HDIP04]
MRQCACQAFDTAAAINDDQVEFTAGFVNRPNIGVACQFLAPKLRVTKPFYYGRDQFLPFGMMFDGSHSGRTTCQPCSACSRAIFKYPCLGTPSEECFYFPGGLNIPPREVERDHAFHIMNGEQGCGPTMPAIRIPVARLM